MERVARLFTKCDMRVRLICAGIGVTKGLWRLQQLNYEVRCVRQYESVIDEVCERDFYPGVPLSGRTLFGAKNVGVPYLLPFGKPGEWASMPTNWQVPFSAFCIQQTIRLFKEIERHSQRIVTCSDLGRLVVRLPQDGQRFVNELYAL